MKVKQFLIHRIRDIDASFRSGSKIKSLAFVLLRQLSIVVGIKEESINGLIPNSQSHLLGYRFHTRKQSIDFLFCSKYYEFETSQYILQCKGKVFIDVGGHIGRFAIIASQGFEKVIAYEPHPSNFKSLSDNVALNNITNVQVVNSAASDKESTITLSDITTNTGMVRITENGKVAMRCCPLTKLVAEQGIDFLAIDLILIDVEEHELEVLSGAEDLLKIGSPKVIIESFENVGEVEKILNGYGYKKIKILDGYNHLFIKESKIAS